MLLTAYLSACSSWQVPATSPQRLIADDRPSRIRVTLEDQSQVELYEPSMVGDTLRGFLEKAGSGPASARGRRDILMAHVTALEIRSADAGKTALLGLGLAAGALVAVVVVHDFLICDGLSC